MATHPHADHIGGMADVVNGISIGKMFMPEASTNTKTYENLLSAVVANNIEVIVAKSGVRLMEDDDLLVYFLAPNSEEYEDLNDYSAVIEIIYGQNSFLFMGDASSLSEKEMIDAGFNVTADVLKIGHHGSRTSTGESFLAAVQPRHAVISCGAVNSYGHPHKETLEKLEDSGVNVLRTDEAGTIAIKSDGKEIQIQ